MDELLARGVRGAPGSSARRAAGVAVDTPAALAADGEPGIPRWDQAGGDGAGGWPDSAAAMDGGFLPECGGAGGPRGSGLGAAHCQGAQAGGLRTAAGLRHTAAPHRLVPDLVAECADPPRRFAAARADAHRL